MKPNTANDTPDQQRVRAVNDAIDQILKQHDLGGVVLLVSRDSAAWKMTIPSWAYFVDTGEGFALRLRLKKDDPEATQRTVDTMHMIGSLRDMLRDGAELFGRIFRQASGMLEAHGAEVVHEPFGGPGKPRLDPGIGKTS